MRYLLCFLLGALVTIQQSSGIEKIEVRQANGKTSRPFESGKPVCLFFVLADCPIANQYAPEINRIITAYKPSDIEFLFVYEDEGLSDAEGLKHAKEYKISAPVVIDRGRKLLSAFGATVSPEAVVVSKHKLQYIGRINDLYPKLGVKRPRATTRDLRDAIDAVIKSRPVPVPKTKAVGCVLGSEQEGA